MDFLMFFPLYVIPNVDMSQLKEGDKIEFECSPGYFSPNLNTLEDRQSTYVNNNGSLEWTRPKMTCIKGTCIPPRSIDNGNVRGNSYEHGDKILYECNEGYRLFSNDGKHRLKSPVQRSCNHPRGWSGEEPICLPIKCPTPIIQGSLTILNPKRSVDYVFNDIMRFKCDDYSRLKGDSEIRCLGTGDWSSSIPTCEEILCLNPNSTEFQKLYPGVITNSWVPGIKDGDNVFNVEPGVTRVTFECLNDSTNQVQSTCIVENKKNGVWDPAPPICTPQNVFLQPLTPPPQQNNHSSSSGVKPLPLPVIPHPTTPPSVIPNTTSPLPLIPTPTSPLPLTPPVIPTPTSPLKTKTNFTQTSHSNVTIFISPILIFLTVIILTIIYLFVY